MNKILLLLLFSNNLFAANAQLNNTLQMGGLYNSATQSMTLPASSVPIILMGGISANTTGNKLSMIKAGTAVQAGYTVTTGKTLICPGFWANSSATALHLWAFGYDTAQFSNNTATVGTDIYYQDASTIQDAPLYLTLTGGNPVWIPYPLVFPSASHPFWRVDGTDQMEFMSICYEK